MLKYFKGLESNYTNKSKRLNVSFWTGVQSAVIICGNSAFWLFSSLLIGRWESWILIGQCSLPTLRLRSGDFNELLLFKGGDDGYFKITPIAVEGVQLQYTLVSSLLLGGKVSDCVNHRLWSLLSPHTGEGIRGPSEESSAERCLNVRRD